MDSNNEIVVIGSSDYNIKREQALESLVKHEIEQRMPEASIVQIGKTFDLIRKVLSYPKLEICVDETETPKRNRQSFANIKGKRKRFL